MKKNIYIMPGEMNETEFQLDILSFELGIMGMGNLF